MTPEQKVALVRSAQDSYGLNQALAVTELPQSTWYYHRKRKVDYEEKYASLLPLLEQIARQHPEYGVPRIMPELRERYDVQVNHKVVERLLGLWDLSLLRNAHRPRPSSVGCTPSANEPSLRPEDGPIWWLKGRRWACFRCSTPISPSLSMLMEGGRPC